MIKANIAAGLADLAEAAYVDFKNVELWKPGSGL